MSQYGRNKPLSAWQIDQERKLDRVFRELDQLRRAREAQQDKYYQVRWAMTHENEETNYPDADANTFPIRFLDAHFTNAQGNQTFSNDPRQAEAVTFAHAQTGQYIPVGLPIPVFQRRGLGGAGAGQWWFMDPPLFYAAKLTAELASGSVADAELHILSGGGEIVRTSPVVTLSVRHLLKSDPLPAYTQLIIGRFFQVYSHWGIVAAACEPDAGAETWETGAEEEE
jgi:hypothetical protein